MSGKYIEIPPYLFAQLKGLTIGEALQRKIINKIGSTEGDFICRGGDDPTVCYAIIQGYAIQCSQKLISTGVYKETTNDLLFFSYVQNGKEHFRLCHPKYLNLV